MSVSILKLENLANVGKLGLSGKEYSYILNDKFLTDVAAGSVNGTSAEPTGGVRTVTDTNTVLSISSGLLTLSTGGAVNTGLWYPIQTRRAGKVLLGTLNTNGASQTRFGWTTAQTAATIEGISLGSSSAIVLVKDATGTACGTYSSGTDYNLAMVMKASGIYGFIKGGSYTNWTLLYFFDNRTSSMYPTVHHTTSTTVTYTADNIRIPTQLWLPQPIAYDTFTRANGALGSTEALGPDNQTLAPLAYSSPSVDQIGNYTITQSGMGYAVNDVLTLTGGATATVTSVTNGAITGINWVSGIAPYTTGLKATTVSPSKAKWGGNVGLTGAAAYSAVDAAGLKPTGAFSISAWFKTSRTGNTKYIFASYSQNTNIAGIAFYITASNTVALTLGKNTGTTVNVDYKTIQSAASYTDGNWHHVVAGWDTTNLFMYVDNVAEPTVSWANAPAYAATNYPRVGCNNLTGTNTNFMTGLLDDVALFNGTALNSTQVSTLYNGELNADATLLAAATAYWRFESGALTTDTTGNGHTLTDIGTPIEGPGASITINTLANPTWTVSSNAAINTPVGLGSELLTNGDMESWASATDLNNWTETLAGTSTVNRNGTDQHSGTYCANMLVDASGNSAAIDQTVTTTNGKWYQLSFWGKYITAGNRERVDTTNPTFSYLFTPTTSYQKFFYTTRATGTTVNYKLSAYIANGNNYFDDVSFKEFTFSELFSSLTTSTKDYIADVNLTMSLATQGGMVLNLDSTSNPLNFILAYIDFRGSVPAKLVKCVNGTYTEVISANVTYSAGATLRVIKGGTNSDQFSLFYNNIQVGSTSTISDVGIISNKNHGLFSTFSGNQLDNWTLFPRGENGEYSGLNAF